MAPKFDTSQNMVGLTNGKLEVIKDIPGKETNGRGRLLECLCSCGNITTITPYNLHRTASCGCLRSPNLLGKVFGKVHVIAGPFKAPNTTLLTMYLCRCECGTERLFRMYSLVSGKCHSCGCATHGSNHHQWKGGISDSNRYPSKERVNRSTWSRRVRKENNSCAVCGAQEILAAHHIHLYCKVPELRYIVENGITMCLACHTEYHRAHGNTYGGLGPMITFINNRSGDISRLFPIIDLFMEDWAKDASDRLFYGRIELDSEPCDERFYD